ncbi:hypothetical protein [Lentibacillus sp. Marseille-P4043]|uniref:hypothetical protein n=1 Tax=Lentibacillus sp. Marseille-P4043 TaxID=2040293 RepID=UPI000D0B939A|nr:hypothetical protein [Lentibacillus sp. Marseille-P4043]
MNFKYARTPKWKRASATSIIIAIINLLLLLLNAYMNGGLSALVIIVNASLAGVGVIMGIYYLNMPHKDYIRTDKQLISIHRGPVIPRKEIKFRDIQRVIVIRPIIELHMKNQKAHQFNLDWLTTDDLNEIKKILKKKTAEVSDRWDMGTGPLSRRRM